MKRKIIKLSVGIGALLIALGISWAFFSGTLNTGGSSEKVEGSTSNIPKTTFTVSEVMKHDDKKIYPGHKSVSGIKVTATGVNEVLFDVFFEGINSFDIPYKYTLYKTLGEEKPMISCQEKTKVVNSENVYFEECTSSNIDGFEKIVSGEIEVSEESEKTVLKSGERLQATEGGSVVYYYVVFEYPNIEENQGNGNTGKFEGVINASVVEEIINNKPTIDNVSNEVSENSILVKVDSFEDFEVAKYYYELGNGDFVSSTSNSYLFDGLLPNEEYEVQMYVEDKDGNQSEIKTLKLRYKSDSKLMTDIVANFTLSSRSQFGRTYSNASTKKLFKATDNYGTTKYYSGAPTDNFVKFAGFYWRIIRINGDNTIRMIYDGDATVIDNLTTSEKQTALTKNKYNSIGQTIFNKKNNDNAYVGFKYTVGSLRGFENKSDILEELDAWYEANLKTRYGRYIDGNTGFCGDRAAYTDSATTVSGGGTNQEETYYAGYKKLVTNKSPEFKCANSDDLYTTVGSTNGNQSLTNPIGLITADEVSFSGGYLDNANTGFYLSGESFYTMTPARYNNGAEVFSVHEDGALSIDKIGENSYGLRPVINLKADTKFLGTGTWNDPYRVDDALLDMNLTATKNSLTVKVNSVEKVVTYFYALDNGDFVESKNAFYTFNGLSEETVYNVKAYALLDNGSTSETIVKTIETDATGLTMDEILAGYSSKSRGSFSSPYTSTNTKTVFTANDGLGTSKYFAGAATDNYVKFGGFYWRIIRMNGNKTTRLIYSGDASVIDGLSNKQEVLANGYNDEKTDYKQAKVTVFNSSGDDNAYVGFKYTKGSLRGTGTKSKILTVLDTWYEANLKTNYGKYIDGNTGFCGDRTPYTNTSGTTSGGGTGKTETYYGGYIRIKTKKSPSLSCTNSGDLYTTSGSSQGNKLLTNPVGLITADEAAFAGAIEWSNSVDNKSFYLYSGRSYWTMTPSEMPAVIYVNDVAEYYASVYSVTGAGRLFSQFVSASSVRLRPVINLASTVRFKGKGTIDKPYEVV